MNYAAELDRMRKRYAAFPMKEKLIRPDWLKAEDRLNVIYEEERRLFSEGTVHYGCIVQANVILFKAFPRDNCPAEFVFSADKTMDDKTEVLSEIAQYIYSCKNNYDFPPPEKYKDIVRAVRDEYDRSSFSFEISAPKAEICFISTIVFRSHIPTGVLKGRIIPLLVHPDRKTAIILPQRYWSLAMRVKYAFGGLT